MDAVRIINRAASALDRQGRTEGYNAWIADQNVISACHSELLDLGFTSADAMERIEREAAAMERRGQLCGEC